jgi:hypothetical protein
MGVAVTGALFAAGFDAANAGVAIGPKAVVNASSRASVLLGASEIFSVSNIVFLRPSGARPSLCKLNKMG